MSAVVARNAEERLASLAVANEVRFARAAMKRALTLDLAIDLLASPPWWLATMHVAKFLEALPGYGPNRVRTLRRLCVFSDGKTVGGLSARQRGELVHELSVNGYVWKSAA